jgi:hypoxanthine phosphoribosyltransferase
MVIELNGKAFLSWGDIEKQVDRLAEQINGMDKKPFYLYGVPRGGLIPATWLSHKTGIKYQQINSAQISKTADLSHILIVDDICDSGETIKKLKENFPKCQTATLYHKETAIDKPDIYGEISTYDWLYFPWENQQSAEVRDNTYE